MRVSLLVVAASLVTGLSALAGPVPASLADHRLDPPEAFRPRVEIQIQSAGGDAVDVSLPDGGSDVVGFATEVVNALGRLPDVPDVTRDVDEDVVLRPAASAQFDERLLDRQGRAWALRLDTSELQRAVLRFGYRALDLVVCVPDAPHGFTASRPPDEQGDRGPAAGDCPLWRLDGLEDRVALMLTVEPDADRYVRLVLGLLLVAAVASLVAGGGAVLLRRGPFGTLSSTAVWTALIATGGAVLAVWTAIAVLAFFDSAVVNLVMAGDLSVGHQVLATIVPTWSLALPGLVFAVTVLRAPVPPFRAIPVPVPSGPLGPGLPAWLGSDRPSPPSEEEDQGSGAPPAAPAPPPRDRPGDWPFAPPD
jgi:hypothetical protein